MKKKKIDSFSFLFFSAKKFFYHCFLTFFFEILPALFKLCKYNQNKDSH